MWPQFFTPRTDAVQFSDVSAASPYAPYILSARAWGWVEGFSDGTLRPDQLITRAEAVTILNRALGRSADVSYLAQAYPAGLYLDVPTGSWAYAEVMEASVAHQPHRRRWRRGLDQPHQDGHRPGHRLPSH